MRETQTTPPGEPLPPEIELALAYTIEDTRAQLRVLFELDARLGRIVSATTETMLGQLRLAWWRDTIGQPRADRPQGDAVMDAIGEHWAGREAALIGLVDGWEHLLAEPPLSEQSARLFAKGRCDALLAAFGQTAGQREAAAYHCAAWRWCFADFAARTSRAEERDLLVRLGLENGAGNPRLPRGARGLAVLGALGLRAVKRGGKPLMDGRGAALTALRAGLSGR